MRIFCSVYDGGGYSAQMLLLSISLSDDEKIFEVQAGDKIQI